jgi:hypothetical protein
VRAANSAKLGEALKSVTDNPMPVVEKVVLDTQHRFGGGGMAIHSKEEK